MKKIILGVLLLTIILTGCTAKEENNVEEITEITPPFGFTGEEGEAEELGVEDTSNLQIYSGKDYSFSYPENYKIQEPTTETKMLTISGENGRIEIFKMKDFGDRQFGLTGEENQEEVDQYAPKETLEKVGYDIWLFYKDGASETKKNLKEIIETLK